MYIALSGSSESFRSIIKNTYFLLLWRAGRDDVVCFKNMANCVINHKWQSSKMDDANSACEADCIVTMAAKIIRYEIREREYDQSSYPTNEDIANIEKGKQWIPHHLQTLLKTIVLSEVKQNSIGHAIVQSSRPRSVITPTLFGLGVEMDHVFGSKWLINELSHLGFSVSYSIDTYHEQLHMPLSNPIRRRTTATWNSRNTKKGPTSKLIFIMLTAV